MIWTILGVSVAVVAIFCIAVSELLVGTSLFETRRAHAALALGFCGAALWFVGRYLARKRKTHEDAGRVFVLFDFRYWGPMFVVLGILILFVQKLRRSEEVIVQAKTAPVAIVIPEPEPLPAPTTNKPVVFPYLKLQGIVLKTGHPVILIDGRTYGIGDKVSGVVVKEINREGALLEKEGEFRMLSLK